jgi:hypothetical protein
MIRRQFIKTLALTAIGSTFIPLTSEAATPAKGKSKLLSVGEILHFDDDLTIKFVRVKKDQRCPINAQCLTAGDAEVILRVKVGSSKTRTVSLHTNAKPRRHVFAVKYPDGMAGIPKSYSVSIASLNPLPYAGKKTRQSDYRLKLAISVAV